MTHASNGESIMAKHHRQIPYHHRILFAHRRDGRGAKRNRRTGVIEPTKTITPTGTWTIAQRSVAITRATLTREPGASTGLDRGRVNAAGREFTAARRKPVTAATPFALSLRIPNPR
ncbi:hypothetical protein KCP78_03915 [Salmonella enterica subsp. enterica]|nr:hypothetical protein KCP78_03915 [Salmonella enterica subsp. enterica]